MRIERLELSRTYSLDSKSSVSTIPPYPRVLYDQNDIKQTWFESRLILGRSFLFTNYFI